MPADARHTVPAVVNTSFGHVAPEPVQVSAGSQMPALARHTVPFAVNVLAGQVAPEPVQTS
jgi:ethanolamine ammonia-lyase large subunit